jgi:hypothetical protein
MNAGLGARISGVAFRHGAGLLRFYLTGLVAGSGAVRGFSGRSKDSVGGALGTLGRTSQKAAVSEETNTAPIRRPYRMAHYIVQRNLPDKAPTIENSLSSFGRITLLED